MSGKLDFKDILQLRKYFIIHCLFDYFIILFSKFICCFPKDQYFLKILWK